MFHGETWESLKFKLISFLQKKEFSTVINLIIVQFHSISSNDTVLKC